ncbi:DUF2637 domain-containing protein [Streptomyces sp. VRA16 Mangrove soil]|uniref:DUF2637 domain-containing protein n=1 Tax=Streptomyces sp. VRA16 Mangrove soil TaxID=2817434 RepID=UPI001A9E018A|nr:DUF2637 domain-containing protein [Streptomyces sp. VRA16 Mangrove soil]MBO1336697.1 DUF2637 domain-containing protein [Streptomyces sp. VRA16 Mangrove soil]
MSRSIRPDAVLIQAVIAGALSFAHLHDLASAAGQTGWKAWAYPVSVDLLLVAAWRRLRVARRDRSAWTWFLIALFASLGANIATAGLLDLKHVPAWLGILVAGWPALAFLGGTLLVHSPTEPTPVPEPASSPVPVAEPTDVPEVEVHRPDETGSEVPELVPAAPEPAPAPKTPAVPPALLDHARKIADTHAASTGTPIAPETLRARLGLPAPMADAIAAHLQLT